MCCRSCRPLPRRRATAVLQDEHSCTPPPRGAFTPNAGDAPLQCVPGANAISPSTPPASACSKCLFFAGRGQSTRIVSAQFERAANPVVLRIRVIAGCLPEDLRVSLRERLSEGDYLERAEPAPAPLFVATCDNSVEAGEQWAQQVRVFCGDLGGQWRKLPARAIGRIYIEVDENVSQSISKETVVKLGRLC